MLPSAFRSARWGELMYVVVDYFCRLYRLNHSEPGTHVHDPGPRTRVCKALHGHLSLQYTYVYLFIFSQSAWQDVRSKVLSCSRNCWKHNKKTGTNLKVERKQIYFLSFPINIWSHFCRIIWWSVCAKHLGWILWILLRTSKYSFIKM